MLNQIHGVARYLKSFLLFSGLTTSVLGLLGMVDIHMGTRLVSLASPSAPLHYNAALGLFILGLGLLAYVSQHEKWTALMGMTLIAFGFFSFIQIFLNAGLGLEKIFFRLVSIQVSLGARLSLSASLGFLMAGLGYFLQDLKLKKSPFLISFTGSTLLSIGAIATLGFLANFAPGYQWGSSAPIPPPVAISFILVGLSLQFIGFEKRTLAAQSLSRWLPMEVGYLLLFSLSLLYLGLRQQEETRAKKVAHSHVQRFQTEFTDGIRSQLESFERLIVASPSQLKNYLKQHPSIESVERIGKEAPPGTEISSDYLRFKVPFFSGEALQGYLVGTYKLSALLEWANLDSYPEGIFFHVFVNEREVYRHSKGEIPTAEREEVAFNLLGSKWKVVAWPSSQLVLREKSFMPEVVGALGIVLSSLFAFLVYFGVVSHEKAIELGKSQKEIERAKEEALEASLLKSEFLTNMSHEIRTPMNAVMGLTELLLDTKPNVEQKKHISAIKFSAESLLTILNEVLDLAKIEAGKMELENTDFDLRQTLKDTFEVFESQAKQKKLFFEFEYSEDTPSVFKGDPNRIRQVVTNFLSNALKFTLEGRILLRVTHSGEGERSCVVRVEVRDTGIGIPENKKVKIFQSFSQVDSSTTRKFGGSGLGLNICKKLIELMQGKIGFESTSGAGSNFYFEIPLEFGHLVAVPEKRTGPSRSTKALRILVAEDNDISRRVLSKTVGKMGHIVDTVTDGHEVLSAMENIQYDLLLLDCQMPGLDGYQASERIRALEAKDPKRGHTPIIALTAHAMVSDRKRCLDAGMDEYLAKPFKSEVLKALIEEVSSKRYIGLHRHTPFQRSKSKEVPRVDAQIIASVFELHSENGAQFFRELFEIYKKTSSRNLKAIRLALHQKNLHRAADIAHSLRSGSSNLGAMRMFSLAERLERAAKSGSIKGCQRLLQSLNRELPKTLEAVRLTALEIEESDHKKAA